ncbi:MAG: hypothetical protein RL172_2118 [Bacteroidota bacterium]|jgi:uncharacterized membrane protein HdeD (DUF308 family)
MLQLLFKNWWVLLLKGILFIVFGLLSIFNPSITISVLVVWFAAFMMVDGVLAIGGVILSWKTTEDKWLALIEGVISLLLGILVYRRPESFVSFIGVLIAFWSIFSGISRIAMAIQLRKEIQGEGWLILAGALSVLFGILVFAQPGAGVATVMMLTGIFALLIGIVLVLLSLKLKKAGKLVSQKIGDIKQRINSIE